MFLSIAVNAGTPAIDDPHHWSVEPDEPSRAVHEHSGADDWPRHFCKQQTVNIKTGSWMIVAWCTQRKHFLFTPTKYKRFHTTNDASTDALKMTKSSPLWGKVLDRAQELIIKHISDNNHQPWSLQSFMFLLMSLIQQYEEQDKTGISRKANMSWCLFCHFPLSQKSTGWFSGQIRCSV